MDEAKKLQLPIPKYLYEKIGNQEIAINLIKKGLLSFRICVLNQEIDSLTKQVEYLRKQVKEMPNEIRRMGNILEEMLNDNKVIETLLRQKR